MTHDGSRIGRARVAIATGAGFRLRLPAIPVLAWNPDWLARNPDWLARRFDAEQERLFLWIPVLFALGIAVYFGLPREPSVIAVWLLAAATGFAWWRFTRGGGLAVGWAAAVAVSLGLAGATTRTAIVAAPVVPAGEWYASIEGLVEAVDLREDGSARLVIAPSAISVRGAGFTTPRRLSLWMRFKDVTLRPGERVAFSAILLPPPDAAVPDGFDYARQAYFDGIGGVGYLVSRPRRLAETGVPGVRARLSIAIATLRDDMAARIMAALPGRAGAIAAALVTGKRGAIPETDQEALRASGLAHILAISGLHMMLVVGTLFWIIRAGLAASPSLALHRPIKKWAAATALAGGTAYLVLSGASVATQRAYVMAAVMLLAILIDRPAITLRNVAIAALIVLAMTPEALTGASFQMSFAATIALVAAYEALRDQGQPAGEPLHPMMRRLWQAVLGLALTSLIAGLATAPYGAFHFNRVAVYGLAANLAAMPLVSLLVMPAGLAACVLMPFGLEALPLMLMGFGIETVLGIAHDVASWPGAIRMMPQMPLPALGLVTCGGLWLALWRTNWRLWGVPAIALGGALALHSAPPDVYINRGGTLVALRTPDGGLTFLPRPRPRAGYEAATWMRHAGIDPKEGTPAATSPATDIDPATATAESVAPESLAASPAAGPGADPAPATSTDGANSVAASTVSCDSLGCVATASGLTVALVRHPAAFDEDCLRSDIVVSPLAPPKACAATALVIGPDELATGGASVVRRTQLGLAVETAADRAGMRPWSRRSFEAAAPQPPGARR